jgi:hypothetical protein
MLSFLSKSFSRSVAEEPYFLFDLRKAINASLYVCDLNGGSLDIIRLIKTLYVADQQAFSKWHRTITGDVMISMNNGPVLSRIYDLACGKNTKGLRGCVDNTKDLEVWHKFFHPRDKNAISMKIPFKNDYLSERELDELHVAFQKIRSMRLSQLIKWVHTFPEWDHPKGSSKPIDPRKILQSRGLSQREIFSVEADLRSVQSARKSLQAA